MSLDPMLVESDFDSISYTRRAAFPGVDGRRIVPCVTIEAPNATLASGAEAVGGRPAHVLVDRTDAAMPHEAGAILLFEQVIAKFSS